MTRAKALGALVVPVLFAVLQSDGMVARAAAKSPKAGKPAAVDGFVEEDVGLPVAVWEKLIPDVGALSAPHLGANVTFSFKTAALTTPEAARYAAMTSSYGFANITFAFKTAALTHAAALTAADAANSLEQERGAATTATNVAEIARYLDFKVDRAGTIRPAPKGIREDLVGDGIKVYWSVADTNDADLEGWYDATVSAYDPMRDVYVLEYTDGFVEKDVDLSSAVWERNGPDVGAMSTQYRGANVTFSFKTAALTTSEAVRYAAMTSSNGFANITFSFKGATLTAAALTAADAASPVGHGRGGVDSLIRNGLLALVGLLVVGAAVALRRRTTSGHEEPGGGGVAEVTEKTPLVAL